MDQLSDPFDEVLMSFGQLMQQQQEGQTQASAEEDELMREHERQMQEHLDEVAALHDWRIRVQLVESLRREIVDTFWNGIPSRRRYYETRSPIEWVPESPSSAALNAIKRELWDSKPLPLNMADAETESDSECDSELRLVRSPQPRISFLIHSPIDPPLFDMDMPETDVNDNPLAPILEATVLSDSISELDLNEALLVQGDAASASDSSLGTIGTMVFEMEMHETVVEPQGTNQDQEASTEVKDDSDIDIDIGEELERVDSRPRALPIAVPGARDGNAHDVEDVFVEQFLRDVRHYTIGFDLDFFPYVVKQWIPGLREAALPGSFEHLLMHMFDDVDNVVRFQEDVRESGIRNYIRGHRKSASNDTELLDDESLQVESQSEAGPSSQRPAITGSTGEGVSEDHSTTDAFFSQELRALRLMVAPLRDHEAPFIWITSRINRPVEMREQFWASRSLIAGFKRQLIRRLRQSESCKFPGVSVSVWYSLSDTCTNLNLFYRDNPLPQVQLALQ